MKNRKIVTLLVSIFLLITIFISFSFASGADTIKLVGSTQVQEDSVYFRTLEKFSELVKEYYGKPIEFDLHHSGDIGNDIDVFENIVQGISVDFIMMAPSLMSNWDKPITFLDTPFLWKDVDHWKKALADPDMFNQLEENLLGKGVRILGYGGGGIRNMILNKPIASIEDLPNVEMRVMGAPIQANVFNATGVQATPMDYLEVYNAIKMKVIDGLENEASTLKPMRFYEVAPYLIMTKHAITLRPICFSEKRFQSFPEDLQQAILKAGREAGEFARNTELAEGDEILSGLEEEGNIERIAFEDRSIMREKAIPVIEAYAKELGVEELLDKIKSIE